MQRKLYSGVMPDTMGEFEKTISAIMEYWRRCAAPTDFSTSLTTDAAYIKIGIHGLTIRWD